MYRAAAIVYPQALATSLTLPTEILRAASQMASVKKRGEPQIQVDIAGLQRRPCTLNSGITLVPDSRIDSLPELDLLILPAIWRSPVPALRNASQWRDQLRAHAEQGTRICSVGTGSFLLAEAGLLDGKAATTHWNYFEAFANRYPKVKLKTRHLITQSDNIYCAGSVNSIADLMVHIVEEWFGSAIAQAVEHQFSPEIRRPFQSAAYQGEADSSHHDEDVVRAQQWLQDHFSEAVTIAELAKHLRWTVRTLNRRFKQATGLTPLAYLHSLRINSARELLRHSNLSIGDVAWQVGIPDISYFARLFRRQTGMSPLHYRQAVRGKLFTPGNKASS